MEKDGTSNSYTYTDDLLAGITSASDTAYTFTYGVFDQIASVKAGDRTLISHTYTNDANRRLSKSEYGNGDYITYAYDSCGRITKTGYEDNANALEYVYDNNGNLGLQKDNIAGRTTKYYYDMQDRLMRYDVTGSGYSGSIRWGYDDLNNLTTQTHTLNGTTYTESYSYDDDNRLTGITNGNVSSTYSYDLYSRMNTLAAKYNNTNVVTTNIGYKNPSTTTTSSQVATWQTQTPNYNKTYTYTYDSRGNITAITDGTNTTTYEYDGLDQLTRENNQAANKTWTYSYDDGGNILEKKEYAYTTGTLGTPTKTIPYGYADSTWKDLLTSYNGQTITSDAIGNITGDGTWSYTWQHGRQLASATDGTTNVTYAYDANGRRIQKTVNGTVTEYAYAGTALVHMTSGGNTLHFRYDSLGLMSVNYNGTEYYYIKNAQGDITGIVTRDTGELVVEYNYDAWGNAVSTTGSMANTLGKQNPFRYRGYIYDECTKLYYLQTRYYDPAIGRFICADGQLNTGEDMSGMNLFAYCGNNPVNRTDENGKAWWHWALAATVVVACAVATVVTCGGFAAAAGAVGLVSSGLAATTAASTVTASAFVASATFLGVSALVAAADSRNTKEFCRKGNWGTVAGTVGAATIGGVGAYVATRSSGLTNNNTNSGQKVSSRVENDIVSLPRTGRALKTDAYHAFPDIVDNYAGLSTVSSIGNATLYQLPGSLNGVSGRFEWIVQDQQVMHRLFVKGGGINGIPILP